MTTCSSRYSEVVLSNYLYVPRRELRNYELAKRLLTAERKYEGDPIVMYDDSRTDWFGVPLYHYRSIESIAEKVTDRRTKGVKTEYEFKSSFWAGQEKVFEKFKDGLARGITGFVLEAPPGFGKTVVLSACMAEAAVSTLVVVPRSNLVEQWSKRLREHTSLMERDIGVAMEGRCDWKGKKVVVGLVHSLALDRYGDAFKRWPGLVIFDEVDRSVPPSTFAPVVTLFAPRLRMGASATLSRQDDLQVVFEKHIGQMYLRGEDRNRMPAKVLTVQFPGDSGHVFQGSAKLNRRGMLLSRLAANPLRNLEIVKYVQLIVSSDRRCLVLSDRTEQLVTLRRMLLNAGIRSEDIGFYARRLEIGSERERGKTVKKYREVSEAERTAAASACKILLGTYGMASVGTDIPDLAGLVMATPQVEVEQTMGRIERMMDGKKQPVVVDFVDTHYADARNWGKARDLRYRRKGLEVKRV